MDRGMDTRALQSSPLLPIAMSARVVPKGNKVDELSKPVQTEIAAVAPVNENASIADVLRALQEQKLEQKAFLQQLSDRVESIKDRVFPVDNKQNRGKEKVDYDDFGSHAKAAGIGLNDDDLTARNQGGARARSNLTRAKSLNVMSGLAGWDDQRRSLGPATAALPLWKTYEAQCCVVFSNLPKFWSRKRQDKFVASFGPVTLTRLLSTSSLLCVYKERDSANRAAFTANLIKLRSGETVQVSPAPASVSIERSESSSESTKP